MKQADGLVSLRAVNSGMPFSDLYLSRSSLVWDIVPPVRQGEKTKRPLLGDEFVVLDDRRGNGQTRNNGFVYDASGSFE